MTKYLTAIAVGAIALLAGFVFWPKAGGRPTLDNSNSLERSLATTTSNRDDQENDQTVAWNRFRGPNGLGVSTDSSIPTEWSETENLSWKTELPGFGASSPVLTKDFVFLTCYSGYGLDKRSPGDISKLKRQVVCVSRADGKIVWSREFASEVQEDPYRGMGVPEHGYATNSCVTDGNHVFAFLGKSGVVAFDFQGKQLWKAAVGTGSSNRQWGSAASLMMANGLLIVNAAEESETIYAFKPDSGEVAWKSQAASLELCFSTPAVANIEGVRNEIIVAVPGEVWALNPKNGKLTWYVETNLTGNLSPSIVINDGTAYAFGGYRSNGSLAIDLSKPGKVTQENILWTARATSYVPSPVLLEGRFYWIDDKGTFYCSDAETGETVFRERVPSIDRGGRPVYASPIAIDGKIYAQTRTSGLFVVEPVDELKVLAQNKFDSDNSVFNATPAVDNGQLFLRSDRFLYCVGK
jgi:outer membrane protein assembly factor BamB